MSKKYRVTFKVSGPVSFIVEAESPEDATDRAYDHFEGGDDGDTNRLDIESVRKVEEL